MKAAALNLASEAAGLLGRLQQASRSSAFRAAIADFSVLLQSVPDCAAGELPRSEIEAIVRTAELVIDAIEERLVTVDDRGAVQRDLATAVYAIRSDLEQIDCWQRHYGVTTD